MQSLSLLSGPSGPSGPRQPNSCLAVMWAAIFNTLPELSEELLAVKALRRSEQGNSGQPRAAHF